MIKSLRRLRQRLLTNNKFGKYLLYAIGEILLVVIGILIALQVDNWNKKKENDLQVQHILSALYEEYKENKTQLEQVMAYNDKVNSASEALLNLINTFPDNYDKSLVTDLIRDYSYYMSYDPSESVLASTVSSGDIHLIENDSLVNLLFKWPSMVSDSKEEELLAQQLLFEQKNDLLFRYIRDVDVWNTVWKSPFNSDYEGLLKNPDFENAVIFRLGSVRELIREQNDILQANNLILNLIEKEGLNH
jgi:hypothetical protein